MYIITTQFFVSSKVQWLPALLEPPAHTHINYMVTDLHGGPKPPAPVEESYRRNILTVSRCVLWFRMQSDKKRAEGTNSGAATCVVGSW